MNQELILTKTADGSHTLFVPGLNEHYHSINGAIAESRHIFIEAGFKAVPGKTRTVNLLEVGLGTGLNVLLTFLESERSGRKVNYVALEPFPPAMDLIGQLNYPGLIGSCEERLIFSKIHLIPWEVPHYISENFVLYKIRQGIEQVSLSPDKFNLVYFDAFSPEVQAEMWSAEIFQKIFQSMEPGGILVTYSAKGEIRRTMKAAGFEVEKLPGPAGKREITRAMKPRL
jgi:tRNA U34 5-methylaminomethyl-2-thiouridine-forming methyltransferase MnmC